MIVFILHEENGSIYGIYSTRTRAEEVKKEMVHYQDCYLYIESYPVEMQ